MARVLIAAGGTGGHLYPAQALAEELAEQQVELFFAGGGLEDSPYFDRELYPYREIACGAFSSNHPVALYKALRSISIGVRQSRKLLKEFKPDLVVGFGSFHTFPTLLAAKSLRLPILLHEGNTIPGKVIRTLAPYVRATAVHFPITTARLKGHTKLVRMPLRKGFDLQSVDRKEAYDYFGFSPERKTLLVFGGSQGAVALNRIVREALQDLRLLSLPLQIIHCTGSNEDPGLTEVSYAHSGIPAYVTPFEKRMDLAWAVADLALTRAGASSIAEQIEFEVPGILIPYPFAADAHQHENAKFLSEIVQGALVIEQSDLTAERLVNTLLDLFPEKIESMKQSIQAYKDLHREETLAKLVMEELS